MSFLLLKVSNEDVCGYEDDVGDSTSTGLLIITLVFQLQEFEFALEFLLIPGETCLPVRPGHPYFESDFFEESNFESDFESKFDFRFTFDSDFFDFDFDFDLPFPLL